MRLTPHPTLVMVGAALSAGLTGTASAGTISQAPSDFQPVTVDADNTSFTFDPSGSGVDSLTMTYSTFNDKKSSVGLSGPDGATIAVGYYNKIASFPTAVYGLQNTSQFGSGNLVSATFSSPDSNFSSSPLYGQTTFVDADGVTQYGYFEGTTSGVNFTLIDYGIVTPDDTAVPEPSTLALLASGVAGIVSLRRRRAAEH